MEKAQNSITKAEWSKVAAQIAGKVSGRTRGVLRRAYHRGQLTKPIEECDVKTL